MKNLFSIFLLTILPFVSFAQNNVQEPEFIGEAFILNNDNSVLELDKSTVQLKTKANAGVYIVGIGKIKTKMEVPGCCSGAKTSNSKDLKVIVKAVNNKTDPLSIIHIFKFTKKKKKRLAELSSSGTFSGNSKNNLDYIKFKGKKYGESSYLLKIASLEAGEYGIVVRNPDALDERSTIVSTFSVE